MIIQKLPLTVLDTLLVVICNNSEEIKLFLHKYSVDCGHSNQGEDLVEEAAEQIEESNNEDFDIENSDDDSSDEEFEEDEKTESPQLSE